MAETGISKTRNLVLVGNIWKARFWVDGKERRRTLGTRSLAEARIRLRTVKAAVEAERRGVKLAEPEPDPLRGPSWEEVRKEYERSPRYRARRPQAKRRYGVALDRVGHFLFARGVRPAAITVDTVDELVEHLREEGLAANTIRATLSPFSQCLERAEARGLVAENPVERFERSVLGKDARAMEPPLRGEADRMDPEIERLMPNLLELTRLLRWTGARLGESLALRVEDRIDRDHVRLHRNTKGGTARNIRLSRAAEVLDRLEAAGARPGQRYFAHLSEESTSVSPRFGVFWSRRLEAATVTAMLEERPLTPWETRRWRLHDYRHAYAVESILVGTPIHDLSRHLGHNSVATTEKYLKALQQLPIPPSRGVRAPWQHRHGPNGRPPWVDLALGEQPYLGAIYDQFDPEPPPDEA